MAQFGGWKNKISFFFGTMEDRFSFSLTFAGYAFIFPSLRLKSCRCSSVGQSSSLVMSGSGVRIPPSAPGKLGRFPSGQRGQTVNLLAQPSEVRTLPSPPVESHGTGGNSSIGRASAFQAEGRGFEPRFPLHLSSCCPRSSVGRARPW